MKALIERSAHAHDAVDNEELAEPAREKLADDLDLHELARRCRVLLASGAIGKRPPGNWLG